ncbi:hypothetical protein COX69_03780, partial [Candidatus Falkowbacteria bacterium CG_4_10_14_0_2_um_filter_48_10]
MAAVIQEIKSKLTAKDDLNGIIIKRIGTESMKPTSLKILIPKGNALSREVSSNKANNGTDTRRNRKNNPIIAKSFLPKYFISFFSSQNVLGSMGREGINKKSHNFFMVARRG